MGALALKYIHPKRWQGSSEKAMNSCHQSLMNESWRLAARDAGHKLIFIVIMNDVIVQ